MDRTTLRRPLALLASAALLGSLAVVTTTAPVVAQLPTCNGQPATITDNDGTDLDPAVGRIVGTNGPDVIVGTDGDDLIEGNDGGDIICGGDGVDTINGGADDDLIFGGANDDFIGGGGGDDDICGDGGNDVLAGDSGLTADGSDGIAGGPGRDRIRGEGGDDQLFGYRNNICTTSGTDGRDVIKGNDGADTIKGGPGSDLLYGNRQSDTIQGQGGNDSIDGGPQVDNCSQGPGTGPIRNCEKADLVVKVNCPAEGSAGIVTCRVKVTNRGPAGTTYRLDLDESQNSGSQNLCINGPGWDEDEPIAYPLLKAGRSRTREFPLACEGGSGVQTFEAEAVADARDPRPANNVDDAEIDF